MKIKMFITGAIIALLLLFIASLFSCCGKPIENNTYKIGDIVYIKPDTLPAVIVNNKSISGKEFLISFRDNNGILQKAHVISEEIFENLTNKPLKNHDYE